MAPIAKKSALNINISYCAVALQEKKKVSGPPRSSVFQTVETGILFNITEEFIDNLFIVKKFIA